MTANRKAQIICMANQKGGVAKTTTTAYLGASLARLNKNVLVIDSDPQCNLTYAFELDEKDQEFAMENNLAAVYESGQSAESCLIRVQENLYIIPASPDLIMTEVSLDTNPEAISPEPETVLKHSLAPLEYRFDYILIDCPPSQGMLTLNSLVASNWVIIPTMASVISLTGLERMLEQIYEISQGDPPLNSELKILGVLLTKFRKDRRVELEIETRLRSCNDDFTVFKTIIPDRSQFELLGELKAQTGRKLIELSMVSYSLLPYLTLAMEVEKILRAKMRADKQNPQ